MKTLRSFFLLSLTVINSVAFADELNASSKLSIDYALKSYIDAVTDGKVKGLSEVLDNDAKFTISQGEKTINYSKSEMLSSLKLQEGIKQNCNTEFQIIEKTANQSIVKVIQKYNEFTRVNFVTFNHTSKGWKITNVSSSFS